MGYDKTNWAIGDIITQRKMNKIEEGLEDITQEVYDARGINPSQGTLTTRLDDMIIISDTQPSAANNEIWVKNINSYTQIPTYAEFIALKNSIAPDYENGNTYSVGKVVFYGNQLYRCIEANTDSEWNSAHWTETTIMDEIS